MIACMKCGRSGSSEDFPKDSRRLNGRGSYCRPCKRSTDRDYYQSSKDRRRDDLLDSRLRTRYGIGKVDYDRMHLEQGGRCLICEQLEARLFVDHNHESGNVRGLLCPGCNARLGVLENREWIERATMYLARFGQ